MTPHLDAVFAISFCSTALFLLPLFTLWSRRIGRRSAVWEFGLDVPLSLTLDVLGVLSLSRIFPVEISVLIARCFWLFAFAFIVLRRRHDIQWPAFPVAQRGIVAGFASALCVGLSLVISRTYIVWDKTLHVPLVSSIGGQTLPFVNVFGANEPLRYHHTGDVIAVMFRALSLSTISSNLALSLAHDVLFGLFGLTCALLVAGVSPRRVMGRLMGRVMVPILGGVALLLHGPLPFRNGEGQPFQGFSYHLFYSLSFRPHVPVSALLLLGLMQILFLRASWPARLPARTSTPMLLVMATLLGMTDEATFMLFGFGLGVMWLVYPQMLAKSRTRGFFSLLLLCVGVLGANYLFGGSLSPGGPVQRIAWLSQSILPSVVPGPGVPLFTWRGANIFLKDSFGYLACLIGLGFAARKASFRFLRPLWILGFAVVAASLGLALHLRVNGFADENQRFFVAPFFATLPVGLFYLAKRGRGTIESLVVACGLFLPPVFSLYWIHEIAPKYMKDYRESEANGWAKETTYPINCRNIAGATLGEKPRLAYLDVYHHYVFTACRPTRVAGSKQGPWVMKTLPLMESRAQLSEMVRMSKGAAMDVVCPAEPLARRDFVCAYVLKQAREKCQAEGTRFLRCSLTPGEVRNLLGR